jgi:hypothetical protein
MRRRRADTDGAFGERCPLSSLITAAFITAPFDCLNMAQQSKNGGRLLLSCIDSLQQRRVQTKHLRSFCAAIRPRTKDIDDGNSTTDIVFPL